MVASIMLMPMHILGFRKHILLSTRLTVHVLAMPLSSYILLLPSSRFITVLLLTSVVLP